MNIVQIGQLAETVGASNENHFIGDLIGAAAGYLTNKATNKQSAKNAATANDFTEK